MRLSRLREKVEQNEDGHPQRADVPSQPDRPSHFAEDVNEYAPRNGTELDYPDTAFQPPHYGFDAPPADPIGVYIVEAPPRERVIKRTVTGDYTLGALVPTVQLGGADLRRTRMLIRNNDADTDVLVSSKQGDINAACFRVVPGKDLEIFHNDAVWAKADTNGGGVVSSISVVAEFEMDDHD